MPSPEIGIQTIYVDDSLLVLNKPAGLLSVPGRGEDKQDCLSARVQHLYPDALIVHRLDMATSGLLLMARGIAMQRALGKQFENREVNKRYTAVVDGCLENRQASVDQVEAWGLIDLPIAADWPRRPLRVIDSVLGKPSQTRWRALLFDPLTHTTRLELEPVTGRSHQLRVHLQALGHAIVGDALYASPAVAAGAERLLLHASQLAFVHPLNGQGMHHESVPPF